jgi:hypothetical protein
VKKQEFMAEPVINCTACAEKCTEVEFERLFAAERLEAPHYDIDRPGCVHVKVETRHLRSSATTMSFGQRAEIGSGHGVQAV